MKKVRLNIDDISEELYDMLLAEFRKQFGREFDYTEWNLNALKE